MERGKGMASQGWDGIKLSVMKGVVQGKVRNTQGDLIEDTPHPF